MIAAHVKEKIHAALGNSPLSVSEIPLSRPENSKFGDFATNIALRLAKDYKKSPMDIANEIAGRIEKGDLIEQIDVVVPGFINISLFKHVLVTEALTFAESTTENWFAETRKAHTGKAAIVEFSSPNIAKPFTIGHLRSTIIGNAVANLLETTGWKVFKDNHLGDWGTQFGKQIYAIKHLGENNEEKIETAERPIAELVKLYVEFHDKASEQPEIEEKAREYFKMLEDGDPEMRRLWKRCIDWSFKEFDSIYKKLNVSFTENNGRGYGESFFEDKMAPIIELLKEKQMMREDKGAWLIYFNQDKYPPLMIIKKDGATLYATRDLATDKFRKDNPAYKNVELVINEVGAEQSLYWQQLFETEYNLGWYTQGQRVHVKHGMYRFKDMKMSTRKGNVIWLEDVLNEAVKKAEELNKDDTNPQVAEIVGIGALKWNDLKRSSHLDIVFDWNDILNMQGNSGPYMQYTYVRTKSILNKEKYDRSANIQGVDVNNEEVSLLRLFSQYPETVIAAAESYAPHILTTYLYELAQAYNLFYQKNPVIKAEGTAKPFRLMLTQATSNILKNGLSILGIATVEKM